MFDIGFWEITVIAVVALIVVGPDEFPYLVRKIGGWIGNARQIVNNVKADLDREVNRADELKSRIEEETRIAELHQQVESQGRKITASVNKSVTDDSLPEERIKADSRVESTERVE